MVELISKNPLVRKIVEGDFTNDLIEMLLNKQLPFTDLDYLESLVYLLKDEKYKKRAITILKDISNNVKLDYMEKKGINQRVAFYLLIEALSKNNVDMIIKIVNNQYLDVDFLKKIAEKGSSEMLEILFENQIKLIAYPEILDIAEKNPNLTQYLKGKINEIRDYYLLHEEVEVISEEDIIENVEEIVDDNEIEEEITESTDEVSDEVIKEEKEKKAKSVLEAINSMNISERVKLALTGTKTERMILIKDPNTMVSRAVIESPKITEDEVLQLAKNKGIAGEIISKISSNREWVKNYSIMLALAQNPKTPVKDALGFVKKLHDRDLKNLSRDRNVNPVVRQLAVNYMSQKK